MNLASIAGGAMYLPPEVLNSSLIRPVMVRNPSESSDPLSPVRSQPSSVSVSAVASGQVVVAVHHTGAGDLDLVALAEAHPAAGYDGSDGAELVVVGVVHEGPCGRLGQAVALEDQDVRGVEPLRDVAVERGGTRDEEADATSEPVPDLGEHELVEQRVLDLQRQRDGLALALECVDLAADREGREEDLLLGAPLGRLHRDDACVRLLEDAWRSAHEGRLHDRQVLDDLVHATVDRGGEATRELGGEQHLAERVRHRQPQELQVVLGQDLLGLDGGALVGPRGVAQAHALGPAGRARGVDQRGQVVRLHGVDRLRDGVGVLGEVLLTERDQIVETDHPVPVPGAVEDHDLLEVRELGLV